MGPYVYNDCKRNLLHVANLLSPTGKEQRGFSTLVGEMEMAGEERETVIRNLIARMLDGLAHGNWPTA